MRLYQLYFSIFLINNRIDEQLANIEMASIMASDWDLRKGVLLLASWHSIWNGVRRTGCAY